MERRKLLATTGAVSLTAAAAVIAIGSNFGVFGLTDGPAKAGNLQPVAATSSTTAPKVPEVITLDVQDPPLAPATSAGGSDDTSGTDGSSGESRDAAAAPVASTPPASATTPHDAAGGSAEHHEGEDDRAPETEHDDD